MTNHEPVTINDTTYPPKLVDCPECDAEIDAQRAFIEGQCPECRTGTRALCDGESRPELPSEDDEPESYKVQA